MAFDFKYSERKNRYTPDEEPKAYVVHRAKNCGIILNKAAYDLIGINDANNKVEVGIDTTTQKIVIVASDKGLKLPPITKTQYSLSCTALIKDNSIAPQELDVKQHSTYIKGGIIFNYTKENK